VPRGSPAQDSNELSPKNIVLPENIVSCRLAATDPYDL